MIDDEDKTYWICNILRRSILIVDFCDDFFRSFQGFFQSRINILSKFIPANVEIQFLRKQIMRRIFYSKN